jgi:hypothetical protein
VDNMILYAEYFKGSTPKKSPKKPIRANKLAHQVAKHKINIKINALNFLTLETSSPKMKF